MQPLRIFVRPFATIGGLALALCLVLPHLLATTLEQLGLGQMISGSTAIVRARVGAASGVVRNGNVFTIYPLDVLDQWKLQNGRIAPHELAVPGGVAGGIRQPVSGAPQLRAGQEYVLFLWQGKSGLTQLMGLSQGLFLVSAPDGRRENAEAVQAPASDEMLDRTGRRVQSAAMSIRLSALKARVAKASLEGAQGGGAR